MKERRTPAEVCNATSSLRMIERLLLEKLFGIIELLDQETIPSGGSSYVIEKANSQVDFL